MRRAAATIGRRAGELTVFVVAGIARPERFFADLASAGWDVVGTMAFRDHHLFTRRDIDAHRRGAHGAVRRRSS